VAELKAKNARLAEDLDKRGYLAARKGRHAPAAALITQAITLCPDIAVYHSHLGNVRQAEGRLDAAILAHRKAIALNPDVADFHYNLGNALALQRRLDEAAASYRRAIDLNPNLVSALAGLGAIVAQQGRLQAAANLYQTALGRAPTLPNLHANLGGVLRQLGRLQEAIVSLRHATALEPNDPIVLCHLASALREAGHGEEASECYRRALACAPKLADVQNTLGNVLRAQGMFEAAAVCYRRALAIKPSFPEALNNLGVVQQQQGALAAAAESYQRAIALKPDLFGAHANLGIVLQEQGALEAAIACYRQSVAIKPDFAEGYSNLGIALQEKGELDAAVAAFETAVELAPRCGAFYRMLAITGRVAPDSAQFHRLEAAAADIASLPTTDQMELHFALGAVYADSGEPEKSSTHLIEGNRLKRQSTFYNEAETLTTFARIEAIFTAEMVQARRGYGVRSQLPIFIVGMPRSGSTLVEQILASHPNVHGAGELFDLPNLVKSLDAEDGASKFPEWVPSAPNETFIGLAGDYLQVLHRHAGSAVHIVDKMPENFLRLGLIHLALPGARVIHVARDPIDTCLSCFSKLFTNNLPYTYNIEELARYYRAYQRLMQHWQTVLPPGTILNIRYEDVVNDMAGQVRRLLAHCELPWADACLHFHQTRRTVRTASLTQVRQPLYAQSIGRWHAFEQLAQPLRVMLEQPAFTKAPSLE
jgi:tetratricopeptide (TPR) repeat protein